jgi:DNA-binding NtrC family response regulator
MSAAPSVRPKILIASADQILSNSRKQVFEQQGWEVTVTRNKQHGLAVLHAERFNILLVCNSVSGRTRNEYATLFREKNPEAKVIVVENGEQAGFAYDALLSSPVSPRHLVDTVRQVLSTIRDD